MTIRRLSETLIVRPASPSQIVNPEPNAREDSRGAVALAWAILVSIALSSLVVAGFTTARPRSDKLAVVFPPWWSAERSLAAAAEVAPVSGVGALPFIVAVEARDAAVRARLIGAGAVLALDGAKFSFCMSK